jgi:glycosyltransferase involved in cell wall biosynthesis
MSLRLFYAEDGPGNIIRAYEQWKGREPSTEVSMTFSGQVEDYCQETGAEIYMTSTHPEKKLVREGAFTLEHRPKPLRNAGALGYHFSQFFYGVSLLVTALRFRADIAIIDLTCTYPFMLFLFRCFRIKVLSVLHCTLWPSGFPPKKRVARFIQWLNKWFWRYGANATLCVSPECARQVKQLAGNTHGPLLQFYPQYSEEYIQQFPEPPPHEQRPFGILFTGRIERNKGVFDILDMAEHLEQKHPSQFSWTICGGWGSALDELRESAQQRNLVHIVNIPERLMPSQFFDLYARSHVAIVPTTSQFEEGLAMAAVESALVGRPVITNSVVPALEIIRPACIEAVTEDVDSYVRAIEQLAENKQLYEQKRAAGPKVTRQFLDRSYGLTAVLRESIALVEGRDSQQ